MKLCVMDMKQETILNFVKKKIISCFSLLLWMLEKTFSIWDCDKVVLD